MVHYVLQMTIFGSNRRQIYVMLAFVFEVFHHCWEKDLNDHCTVALDSSPQIKKNGHYIPRREQLYQCLCVSSCYLRYDFHVCGKRSQYIGLLQNTLPSKHNYTCWCIQKQQIILQSIFLNIYQYTLKENVVLCILIANFSNLTLQELFYFFQLHEYIEVYKKTTIENIQGKFNKKTVLI